MPNHVHLLISPTAPLSQITKSVKGYSALSANKILGRTGEPFWRQESFDHWVRDSFEGRKIVRYIENNPRKAGLAESLEAWPWSSAAVGVGLDEIS